MTTLLVAEHAGGALNDATSKAMSAAAALGSDVHVLVAGKGVQAVAEAAAKLSGAAKVLVAESDALEHQLAEPMADLIVGLAGDYDAIVAPATANGKNTLPRVAALLDVMQISDVTAVIDAETFERPIYAGNAIQTVKSGDAKKVITVRTSTFAAAEEGGSAAIETVAGTDGSGLSEFVGEELSKSDRPELTSAKIIISGGRALGSEDNFAMKSIMPVADKPSAPLLVHPVQLLMPGMPRTTGRSARQVRSWLRIFTLPAASPVRSSTLPA